MRKQLLGLKGAQSSINVIPSAVEEPRGATYGNFAGCLDFARHDSKGFDSNAMSGKIVTREFSIDDYDAVLQLWQTVGRSGGCGGR